MIKNIDFELLISLSQIAIKYKNLKYSFLLK